MIDVPAGGVIARGLSMPHSPRWHDGRLWLLESGTGRLVVVDAADGRVEAVAELPGFARGLAAHGPYAFVGLSKIRASSAMDGVPLAARRGELKCGVAAVDLRSGRVVGLLEFQTAVEEIFDVQLLVGVRFPEVIGFQQETLSHTFLVPAGEGSSPQGSGAWHQGACVEWPGDPGGRGPPPEDAATVPLRPDVLHAGIERPGASLLGGTSPDG